MGMLLKRQPRPTETQDPLQACRQDSGAMLEEDGISYVCPTSAVEATGQAVPPCISTTRPVCSAIFFEGHR